MLARVNGETIERWEFDNAVKRIEARAGGPVPPDKRDEVLRGVLDQLVAYHLLAQESRARKMAVHRRRRRRAARRNPQGAFRPRTLQAGHRGAGADARAAEGAGADRASRWPRSSRPRCNSRWPCSDPEVKAFYEQNLDRFKQGDSVHAAPHPDRRAAERDAGAEGRREGRRRRRC